MSKDWSDASSRPVNEHGSKAQIGVAKDGYSEWRRTVGHQCYANDVDWLEWRIGPRGEIVFVAVIETTFYEDKPEMRHLLPKYRVEALKRFKRDAQHRIALEVARLLTIPAYFVVIRRDLCVFHVCRLSDEQWREMLEPTYRRWIRQLGRRALVTSGPGPIARVERELFDSDIPW